MYLRSQSAVFIYGLFRYIIYRLYTYYYIVAVVLVDVAVYVDRERLDRDGNQYVIHIYTLARIQFAL